MAMDRAKRLNLVSKHRYFYGDGKSWVFEALSCPSLCCFMILYCWTAERWTKYLKHVKYRCYKPTYTISTIHVTLCNWYPISLLLVFIILFLRIHDSLCTMHFQCLHVVGFLCSCQALKECSIVCVVYTVHCVTIVTMLNKSTPITIFIFTKCLLHVSRLKGSSSSYWF